MNVIKFPGYLHEDRKGYWHGCKYYAVLKDLIGDLTETEKARLTGFAILSLFPFLATMAVAECAQLAKGHLSRWLGPTMEGLGPTSLFCVRGLP